MTRYTDFGLLGVGVHITTNSIGVPIAFAEAHNVKVRAERKVARDP